MTFRVKMPLGWYEVETYSGIRILGLCEQPKPPMSIIVPDGNRQQDLSVSLHEILHSCGIPDRILHKEDDKGRDCCDYAAKALTKLGWTKPPKESDTV